VRKYASIEIYVCIHTRRAEIDVRSAVLMPDPRLAADRPIGSLIIGRRMELVRVGSAIAAWKAADKKTMGA
jgi:hypothetical protein